MVAKVEFHFGELFPRVGLIVTKLEAESRAVVRFYNKRGTAEQWIKEGKQAVKMTRLSCHRFRSNEVRLWLSLIAYNLGNLWRRLVLPKKIENWSLTSLQQRLVKTGGRLVKLARYYWLMLAESHLTRRLFGSMVRRIDALAVQMERAEQQATLSKLIDRIRYNGRQGQAGLCWAGDVAGEALTVWVRPRASAPPVGPAERAKEAPESGRERLPRITRLLALALRLEDLLRGGTIGNSAELARLGGVSRARITQILNLRNLAPVIQEEILWVTPGGRVENLTEGALLRLTAILDWRRQTASFDQMLQAGGPTMPLERVGATREPQGERPPAALRGSRQRAIPAV